jgi:hypothetical protein
VTDLVARELRERPPTLVTDSVPAGCTRRRRKEGRQRPVKQLPSQREDQQNIDCVQQEVERVIADGILATSRAQHG